MSDFTTSSRYTEGGINESEAHRLQREAENFTKKFEHERKRLLILEDHYKQALKEKKEKQADLKNIRPTTAQTKKNKIKLKQLENHLEKGQVTYSNTLSKNSSTKKKIDMLRKEYSTAKRVIKSLEKDIEKKRKKIRDVNQKLLTAKKSTEDTNVKILGMKSHSEEEKLNFENQMLKLQEELNKRDETTGELEKSTMKDTSIAKTKTMNDNVEEEFANPADVLKARLAKWKTNNKEKKHLLDKYIRNVKVLEDAFKQIKEQTGIASIDEIVTTFIKAEEQNHSLYNYVNILNSDIDTIEEQNRNISEEIKKNEEITNLTEAEKTQKIEDLKQEISNVKSGMDSKENEMKELEGKMANLQNDVQKMVTKFQESKFRPAVAQPMSYDEETVFNNKNVTMFLAELEEYISELITHNEYKKNNPNAAISAIPLEKLNPKAASKGGIKPDLPSKEEVVIADDAQDGEEVRDKELVIHGKDLYKKFTSMVQKSQISYSSIKHPSNSKTLG
uniref:ODAD1 central coiled coil region domain-containing protein n=1 Tax=Euplotes crassus TaxID=5936 RepID=A0A7S3NV14_EUPCR|mmetsp:Transcript_20348/g.20044  ORF Transcript_20348/g.20044 Transcript_20348/m.20044 type:complete len:504 (+) Transcript_20348:3-1514(+)